MEEDKKLLQSQISELYNEIKKKEKVLDELKKKQIHQNMREYFTTRLSASVQEPIDISIVTVPTSHVNIIMGTYKYTLPWHEAIAFVGELRNLILKTINNENEEMVSVAKELLDLEAKFKSYKFHTYDYDNVVYNNKLNINKMREFDELPWYKKMFFKFNK